MRKKGNGETYRPRPGNVRPVVDEICAVNALYAEFDAKDFIGGKIAIREHISELPAIPSVIIDSGGYQCYWLLRDPVLLDNSAARMRAKDAQAR